VDVMSAWQAALLGLVQGSTEFLPVSGSALLLLVGRALAWGDPGAAFTAVTQLGTEAAVLLFRRDLTPSWQPGRGDCDVVARGTHPGGTSVGC
jgi:undecaprenyl pyrophosphate phosphatase UppP